jgi:ribonucleoside-triphosphate reductase
MPLKRWCFHFIPMEVAMATAIAGTRAARFSGLTLDEIAAEWSCRKRDGKVVPFAVNTIRRAVDRCFTSIGMADADRPEPVERVTRMTIMALASQHETDKVTVTVEDVQRIVIQQLWAAGLFDAAEHYQNYREQHRRARAERPISVEYARAVTKDQMHFPTDLQYYQFISKFSRWREEENRRETWQEAVFERIMPWFAKLPAGEKLDQAEWDMLAYGMYDLQAFPAMRVVQMAGPALERCHVGVYNCAYHPIEDLQGFCELLYILMQGTGAAFSVEYDYIGDLPRIKKQKKVPASVYVIEDSTEGWCNALDTGLRAWFSGTDVEFQYHQIRPAGTRLKTKGGRASGPEPLKTLLDYTRKLILGKQGRFLADIDVHDICCMVGKIVQVGGVRRASCLSLSDLDSQTMRHAKSGRWWESNSQRSMANNSSAYDTKPPVEVFMEEWLSLVRSKSGERGLFNREACTAHLPRRRKAARFGTNPCAEIILRPYQFCNLSIAIARPDDTEESLLRKVTIATYFGMLQTTATNFRYIRPDWKRNVEEERLLGVDITGHADCPLLQYGAPGRRELLAKLKARVDEIATMLSKRFGINRPAADTCVKPSGDSSVFFDCGSGISARFAQHQWRWVRESVHSPVAKFLIDEGVPYAPAPEDPSLYVFGYPKKAPKNCTLRNDLTAIQQLENWLEWKQVWAEHSVSATIYVEEHEWFATGAWVYDHFDHITGLSFLPKDNGSYKYAPNEELTEEQYEEVMAAFPQLNWAKLCRYELEDSTESAQTLACTGGSCELN